MNGFRSLGFLILLGVGFAAGVAFSRQPSLVFASLADTAEPIHTHLYRFEIRPQGEAALAKWMQFEKDHHDETLSTLEDEAMYFEAVFPDSVEHPHYLYWLAVNGVASAHAKPRPIDEEFRKLEAETLVKGSRIELPSGYVLIPPFLQSVLHERSNGK